MGFQKVIGFRIEFMLFGAHVCKTKHGNRVSKPCQNTELVIHLYQIQIIKCVFAITFLKFIKTKIVVFPSYFFAVDT